MSEQKPMHGTSKAKGCSHLRLGNFSRLFPKLDSWADEFGIKDKCEAEEISALLGGAGGIMHDVNSDSGNSDIPAAYTFFAQFVDHDITLDTSSKLHGEPSDKENQVEHLPNMRSPSLDLDSIYGFGPEVMPFLYDQRQSGYLLTGNSTNPNDVPRNKDHRALIGDPRNDENIYLSQMQLMFLRFHNSRLIGRSFEQAQQDCRYHYQWIVFNDFLKRVCDKQVYDYAVRELQSGEFPKCMIKDKCGRLSMPVEFSVAAYRFGHTMVSSVLPANKENPVIDLFDERFGTEGFGPVPPELTVDWQYLLDIEDCHEHVTTKAIDHLFADELIRLPDPIVGRFASENDRSLAFRNLLRSYALGLPCGQSVAKAIKAKGYPVKPDQNLQFGKIERWACLEPKLRKKLETHTPLFFYLMREAGAIGKGKRLGPVGSAILLEVFGNMLVHCDTYWSNTKGKWRPDPCIAGNKELTLADIARYVMR